MRTVALILIMLVIVPVSGCCCGFGSPGSMTDFNKNNKGDQQSQDEETEESELKNIAPLEGAMKMKKIQDEMQKLIIKIENAEDLTDEELEELQQEIDQKQEQMIDLSEAMMNSDFMKEQKDNPIFKNAMEQQRKAKEAHDEAMMNQKQIIDEIEGKRGSENTGEEFEEEFTIEEDYELDPEDDAEFADDVYMPDEF